MSAFPIPDDPSRVSPPQAAGRGVRSIAAPSADDRIMPRPPVLLRRDASPCDPLRAPGSGAEFAADPRAGSSPGDPRAGGSTRRPLRPAFGGAVTAEARRRWRIGGGLALLGGVAWLPLVFGLPGLERIEWCGSGAGFGGGGAAPGFVWRGSGGEPLAWAWMAAWALMVVAMMAPTLTSPLHHVFARSFPGRRSRLIGLFLGGYGAVWMLVAAPLLALHDRFFSIGPGPLAAWFWAALVALLWQCSPWKQRCLNRAHRHQELRAFEPGASLDALRFGAIHGVWCVGSCWALMVVGHGNLAAMVAVTCLIAGERLDRPLPPRWCWRCSSTFPRFLFGLARHALGAGSVAKASRCEAR